MSESCYLAVSSIQPNVRKAFGYLRLILGGALLGAPCLGYALLICPDGATTQGIDVSSHNGVINWATVASSGEKFAIARAGDGTGFIDPQFAQNWLGMNAAGLIRGASWFFEPNQSVSAQANLFLSTVGSLGVGDLPPILDVEVTDGKSGATIASEIQQWVTLVGAATGREPLVYTGAAFWNSLGDPPAGSADLWIANWRVSCPNVPSAWTDWQIWQYSDTQVVPGVSGTVGADKFNGPLSALQAYTRPVPDTNSSFSLLFIALGALALARRRFASTTG